ncbi:glycoside hydrolase 43 family protein [Treponema berlinense]|uniref:glycoside hydrolase 43 family protein n=1 Tax=Treponema berlinense TaxID=225004 RepID=UPI0026E98509|nr:glycoside hydrolase 43 family protein [Treponema berlinense]
MYKNPIILCDYSDPDVIRVGNNYFMVASSFNFTPGLPVLTSRNLTDWKLINYAAENIPLDHYRYPQNARGIWAPAFSYHNGIFYIVVGLPDEGIFLTQTEDILGDWSPLRKIYDAKGFIDPFLFWDDDGKAYVFHAYAKSRCGFNSKIGVLDFNPESKVCEGDDRFVFDGTVTQPTIEGPKVYKHNGFYYIFAPAGGVSEGWQAVLRSKNPEGPWESKIVLYEGNSGINGPHQGAWVETASGENWFIHFQERGIYGRITHLEPVKWHDDWPLMGTSVKTLVNPGEPVLRFKSPKVNGIGTFNSAAKNAVRAFKNCNLEWQWSGNHSERFGRIFKSFDKGTENICLTVLNEASVVQKNGFPVLWNSSNVLTQKIQYENFYLKTFLDVSDLPVGGRAGVIFLADEYASVAVERTAFGFDFVYLKSKNEELSDDVRVENEVFRKELPFENDKQPVKIRMDFTSFSPYSGAVQFCVKTGASFRNSFSWKSEYFSTENAHWVGGRFGFYAVGKPEVSGKGSAVFKEIKILH